MSDELLCLLGHIHLGLNYCLFVEIDFKSTHTTFRENPYAYFNIILTGDKNLKIISPLIRPEEKSAIELNRLPSCNLKKKKDTWVSY